jgi:hypothetical protein
MTKIAPPAPLLGMPCVYLFPRSEAKKLGHPDQSLRGRARAAIVVAVSEANAPTLAVFSPLGGVWTNTEAAHVGDDLDLGGYVDISSFDRLIADGTHALDDYRSVSSAPDPTDVAGGDLGPVGGASIDGPRGTDPVAPPVGGGERAAAGGDAQQNETAA